MSNRFLSNPQETKDYKKRTIDMGENWVNNEAAGSVSLLRSSSQALLVCRNRPFAGHATCSSEAFRYVCATAENTA